MIRRNFLKILMASPLGFLIKKKPQGYITSVLSSDGVYDYCCMSPDYLCEYHKKLRDKPVYCWTPAGDDNLPFDKRGFYTGCYWKVEDAKWTTYERDGRIFTVWKNGKVVRTFKVYE